MNDFTIRRRMESDGLPDHEIEAKLANMASDANDEQRDRDVEQQHKESVWPK